MCCGCVQNQSTLKLITFGCFGHLSRALFMNISLIHSFKPIYCIIYADNAVRFTTVLLEPHLYQSNSGGLSEWKLLTFVFVFLSISAMKSEWYFSIQFLYFSKWAFVYICYAKVLVSYFLHTSNVQICTSPHMSANIIAFGDPSISSQSI